MQSSASDTTHSRSKLEYLYRDLLVQGSQLSDRNAALAGQIERASATLAALPDVLRQASSALSNQAAVQFDAQSQQSLRALTNAQVRLDQTVHVLHRRAMHNVRLLAGISALCALVGALVGSLVTVLVLQT